LKKILVVNDSLEKPVDMDYLLERVDAPPGA